MDTVAVERFFAKGQDSRFKSKNKPKLYTRSRTCVVGEYYLNIALKDTGSGKISLETPDKRYVRYIQGTDWRELNSMLEYVKGVLI